MTFLTYLYRRIIAIYKKPKFYFSICHYCDDKRLNNINLFIRLDFAIVLMMDRFYKYCTGSTAISPRVIILFL